MLQDSIETPLRLAVLGDDPELLTLVAGASDPRFEVVQLCQTGALTDALKRLAPNARINDTWEALASLDLDGVLFGRTIDSREGAGQLKHLVRQQTPLVVVHPPCEPIVALEVEMIHADVGAPLIPWCAAWNHPLFNELRTRVQTEAALGKIERVVFERNFTRDESAKARDYFARDAHMIQRLVGRIAQVQGMGVTTDTKLPANVSVQMTADNGALTQWTGAILQEASATLAVIGGSGKIVLNMPAAGDWKLTAPHDSMQVDQPPVFAAEQTLGRLAVDVQPGPTWADACRSLEVLDAAEFSLRRGKTTLITDERPSEESTFKGMMAAGGCGFLLFTFFAFLAVLAIDAADPPFRDHMWWRAWPWWVCAPMAIFLALQLLQFVFRAKPTDEPQ